MPRGVTSAEFIEDEALYGNREAHLRYWQRYYAARKDEHQEFNHKRRKDYRVMAIARLGGSCVKCGFSDHRGLAIDHIVPLSAKGEKRIDSRDQDRAIVLGKINLDNLQVLCGTCHMIKNYEENHRKD